MVRSARPATAPTQVGQRKWRGSATARPAPRTEAEIAAGNR